MKKRNLIIFTIAILTVYSIFMTYYTLKVVVNDKQPIVYASRDYTDWEILTLAFIWQESYGINKNILQITPIYVRELQNHGFNYKIEDIYNRSKSIKMFNDMNDLYNPQHDFIDAITLHNPRGGNTYKNGVLQKYHILKNIMKKE